MVTSRDPILDTAAPAAVGRPTATPSYSYGTMALFGVITVSAAIGLPLYGYFYGFTAMAWVLLGVLYLITGLGITVGYHRLISHRSFECPQIVKGALLIVGGWALQNSALKWASDHIRHHARCDQSEDPYNAQRGFWYSHCGWLFQKDAPADDKYTVRLRRDPVVMWQHRHYLLIVTSGLLVPFAIGLMDSGWQGGLGCFLLAGIGRIFLVLNSTFCINSICHLVGRQPHGRYDSSRDNGWVSWLTFGEGYHNYHHMYPNDYRNGAQWHNFDPSKWLIFTLDRLGLASSLRRAHSSLPHPLS
jgi:stearoyl-CoA desaturase (delta-9 desaturase)